MLQRTLGIFSFPINLLSLKNINKRKYKVIQSAIYSLPNWIYKEISLMLLSGTVLSSYKGGPAFNQLYQQYTQGSNNKKKNPFHTTVQKR